MNRVSVVLLLTGALLLAGALLLLGTAIAWASSPVPVPTVIASFDQSPAFAESLTGGLQPTVLTTLPHGDGGAFAESMAADSHGNLYVSTTLWAVTDVGDNTGELWRVAPDGDKTLVATMDLSPYGMLVGVAVDGSDRVYVAVYDFSAEYGVPDSGIGGSGIFRLDAELKLTRVALLPPGSWPNGIAFHKGRLYISDSARGAIWRVSVGDRVATPTSPWFQDALLTPTKVLGINGIAFKGEVLYAVVYDVGRVVRIPLKSDGTPGTPSVLCKRPELKTGDGIAFDVLGRLWITTNGVSANPAGALYRVSSAGATTEVFDDPAWLNYPTMPVFGRTMATATTLFVANGAYNGFYDGSSPDIISLQVGVPGLPLR